jgi:hypothetical protein
MDQLSPIRRHHLLQCLCVHYPRHTINLHQILIFHSILSFIAHRPLLLPPQT